MTDPTPIIQRLLQAGACAVGIAPAGPVPSRDAATLDDWLAGGYNAGMAYMADWRAIRLDPRLLLEGARSVISMAFPYPLSRGLVASYACSYDYHDVLRRRLREVTARFQAEYGGEYRICIDSAPILERYWAERCGVGVRGRNGLIIVPGRGSHVFLAEIVTTLSLRPAEVAERGVCPPGCDRCLRACPAGALMCDGRVDARRCLSYLTIEHRGEWDEIGRMAMATPAGRHTLFGCELCLRACPLNGSNGRSEGAGGYPAEFEPREEIVSLTADDVRMMTQEGFSRRFRGNPIKRAKLAGLQRNANNICSDAGIWRGMSEE